MVQIASANRYQILHTHLILKIFYFLHSLLSYNIFHYSRNNFSALKQAEFRGCVIQIYEDRQKLLRLKVQQSTFLMQR